MKKRILLLAAFALMALMAPLGAKGQANTGLTVRQARNHAGDGQYVQFTGYVNYRYDYYDGSAKLFIQDNDASGAGICVFVPRAKMNNDIQEGSEVSVRAYKVTCQISSVGVCIFEGDVVSISIISQNHGISVMTPSLQGMKDMHYPLTEQRVINDPFQDRLVRLNWLKIVDHWGSYNRDGWIVEDLHGVRDTVNFDLSYPFESLQVGTMFKRLVALNIREQALFPTYNRLFVRKAIDTDITNLVTLQEARQLATQSNQTGTEVSVIGVVSFARFGDWNSGEIYMQTPNGGSGYGGMKVVTVGDPASRGITTGTKIIVTGTPRVINTDGYPYGPGHNNAPDMVAMMNVDVTSITVISQDAPYSFGNKTLADLRQNNPTISNVKNNTYQHNMVKLNNLTVVQHLDDKTYHGETYHYYEVSQGSGNNTVTDVLLSRDELAQNMVLPSVKVVNCRSNMLDTYHYDSNLGLSGDNHPNHLLLRSLNDIDFNTKSISYVRTHRDAPYYVEGVITARIPCEEIPGGYSFFIQDNTGGLRVNLYPELASQLAIGDRCIARVQSELADINDVYMFAYCDFITKIGSNESFTPYNGVSLAQLYAIPNLGNNIPSLNFDGRYYQFPTMQMKVRSRSHGQQGQPDEYLYVEFSQTG